MFFFALGPASSLPTNIQMLSTFQEHKLHVRESRTCRNQEWNTYEHTYGSSRANTIQPGLVIVGGLPSTYFTPVQQLLETTSLHP